MNTIKNGNALIKIATKQKAFLAVVAMFILMLFFKTNFYTAYNLFDLLNSTSVLLILAFGVTLTVISGGCDLSVGGIMVVSGIVAIQWMNSGVPMVFAIMGSLLIGVVVGFVNGFLVVHQKTEPFIITLGMGMLLTGLALQITNARPVIAKNPGFVFISNGKLIPGIPNLVIMMLVVLLITHFIMRYTQFGRNCYAIGGDYDVALYSGINVVRIKWATYVICGFTASLAGIMLSSKLNSGSATFGETTALVVNCGVVVGGTSFAGGIGGIPQSALGLLVFGVLENAMNMLGIASYIQIILKGVVIVGIIWLDCYYRKRKRETV